MKNEPCQEAKEVPKLRDDEHVSIKARAFFHVGPCHYQGRSEVQPKPQRRIFRMCSSLRERIRPRNAFGHGTIGTATKKRLVLVLVLTLFARLSASFRWSSPNSSCFFLCRPQELSCGLLVG